MSECRSFRIFGGLLGLFFDDSGNIEYGILPNRIRMTLVREHPEKIDGQTDRYTDRRKDRGNNDVYVSTERTRLPRAGDGFGRRYVTLRYGTRLPVTVSQTRGCLSPVHNTRAQPILFSCLGSSQIRPFRTT